MKKWELYENRIRIGKRIAEVREIRGITQVELSEKTGLMQQNISRIETGKYATTIDVLYKICEGLNCDITFILR